MEREEIWKNVEGYQDYFVSNLGRVKSTKYKTERILKPVYNKNGYLYVSLYYNGKIKTCKIHRLVAKAFIPNPSGLPQINHIDENPHNNVVSNLEWCSAKYNNNFGSRKSRAIKALLNRSDLSRPVKQLSLNGEVLAIYPSLSEAARNSGLSVHPIWKSANGITKNPRTFRWEYI